MNKADIKKEITAEEVLDKYFPKGNKQRGNALLLFAVSKLEGRTQTLEKVKEIINQDLNTCEKMIISTMKNEIANDKWISVSIELKRLNKIISELEDDEVEK